MANTNPKSYGGKEILFSLFIGLVGIAGVVYYAGSWKIESSNLKGQPAPEIEFELENGKPTALSKHKGTTVLLNFWASWCQPCMEEMPALKALESHFAKDGLLLLAFNIEETNGDELRGKLAGDQMPKNLIFDFNKAMLRPYDVKSIPLSVIIDKHGVVQNVFMGPRDWMGIESLREIETILHN